MPYQTMVTSSVGPDRLAPAGLGQGWGSVFGSPGGVSSLLTQAAQTYGAVAQAIRGPARPRALAPAPVAQLPAPRPAPRPATNWGPIALIGGGLLLLVLFLKK